MFRNPDLWSWLTTITGLPGIVWLLMLMAIALVTACVIGRRWPETDETLELAAYTGGVWAGIQMLIVMFAASNRQALDLAMAAGGAVAIVIASARGALKVLVGILPKQPEEDTPPRRRRLPIVRRPRLRG